MTDRFDAKSGQWVYLGLAVDETEHLLSRQLGFVVVLDIGGGSAYTGGAERQREEHPVNINTNNNIVLTVAGSCFLENNISYTNVKVSWILNFDTNNINKFLFLHFGTILFIWIGFAKELFGKIWIDFQIFPTILFVQIHRASIHEWCKFYLLYIQSFWC